MRLLYEIIVRRGESCAEITGIEDVPSALSVPETLGAFPVRRIGKRAFSGCTALKELRLPESVAEIAEFALYGCSGLQRIQLTDRTEEIGSGAVQSCSALSLLEIYASRNCFAGLKDCLADTEAALRVLLHLPDGDALLCFPAFVNDFDEDTRARAIHPRIEGSGYSFRETVTRRRIDFQEYDGLFPRAMADGREIAAEIALARLRFPYRLSAAAAHQYEQCLPEFSEFLLPRLVRADDTAAVSFLSGRGLLSETAVTAGLKLASELRKTELCGILMAAAGETAGVREAETFSLEDL